MATEYTLRFVGYPDYTVRGPGDCFGYDDKGKKNLNQFEVGDKYWIIDSRTNKRVGPELTVQSIEIHE